jgi:hypothetical protein
MKIKLIETSPGSRRLDSLEPGDFFVRNAAQRPMEGRKVYMVLHPHSRLAELRKPGRPCVGLHNGRITSISEKQIVLKVKDNIEAEVVQ